MTKTFLEIFSEINKIPRPSHHEERIADYLCCFAVEHGLKYRRDAENCVVIQKPATPGYENAEPVVILNHMDMVCVAKDGYLRNGRPYQPLSDNIRPYIEEVTNADGTVTRWMKAEGTSLGADNGMGLSMALAVLADDSLIHPAIEVLTTTNEEDGMSGAEALSTDFIKGRKVINLDSEAFDEITVGAAGAYLQIAHWSAERKPICGNDLKFLHIIMDGGLGGHSGVDINKGRCNCNKEFGNFFTNILDQKLQNVIQFCSMNGGTANASIAAWAEIIVAIPKAQEETLKLAVSNWNNTITKKYAETDPAIKVRVETADQQNSFIPSLKTILACIAKLPFGVMEMRKDMPGTVMTSNNIGVVSTSDNEITVSCHTRSFSDDDMHTLGISIKDIFEANSANEVTLLMDTPAWFEREDSPLLALTCDTFKDVLGFEPKKVAMHFVLEAAYYVQKYPGVEIASIGPLIIEPHSTSERVDVGTAEKIWLVTVELLRRLAEGK